MIYLDETMIGPKTVLNTWLETKSPTFLSKQQTSMISLLCHWIIEPCLDFVTRKCEQLLDCSKMHLTCSFIKLFECMLEDIRKTYEETEKSLKNEEEIMEQELSKLSSNNHLEIEKTEMMVANFFLSVVWSIGAVLKKSSKEKFSFYFNELCENSIKSHQR